MKSATTRIAELLASQGDADADSQTESSDRSNDEHDAGDAGDDEPTTMSRDDLKTTVKEGVAEALEEHDRSAELEQDASDDESSNDSSGLRKPLALLASLGTLAAVGYLRRRRQNQDDDQHDTRLETADQSV